MATAATTPLTKIEEILGPDARALLEHRCETVPNEYDQIPFGTVREAWEMGAVALGATIYFGSEQSSRQIVEVSRFFHEAHELGMATILWCYLRNPAFNKDGTNYEVAADLTAQ